MAKYKLEKFWCDDSFEWPDEIVIEIDEKLQAMIDNAKRLLQAREETDDIKYFSITMTGNFLDPETYETFAQFIPIGHEILKVYSDGDWFYEVAAKHSSTQNVEYIMKEKIA